MTAGGAPTTRPGRRRVALRLLAALGAGLVGGVALAQPVSVRDARGTLHRFAAPPQRIVTMLPSLTETAWVLGAGTRLVGVDRHSNWPADIARLPRLGGLDDVRVEAIAALKPDVILASPSSQAMDRLQALGFAVVRLKSQTHADVRHTLDVVAQLLGTPQQGLRAWERIDREIDAAADRVPAGLRGQRVYFEIGGGPYAAGTTSFIGQTLARLGLANIVAPELGASPKLNPEYVLRAKPDLVIGMKSELVALAQRPGWDSLAAVRGQRLCGFDPEDYDVLVRPGPRMGEAAALLADCLARLPREPQR